MKEEQHIQDIFNTIRELPPEVELAGIEQFVLAQPITAFQPPAGGDGGTSGLLTIKNTIVMISSISIIGSVALFFGGGNDKPSAASRPASMQQPLYEDTAASKIGPHLADASPVNPDTPQIHPAAVYLFNPANPDSAPLNEIMIGPNVLSTNMPFTVVSTSSGTSPVNIRVGKSECDDENHVVSSFVKELEKDGLLDPKRYHFVFRKDALLVGRKKVSDELYPKYERMYEKLSGKKLNEATNIVVSYSNGSCSISVSEGDRSESGVASPRPPAAPAPPAEPRPVMGAMSPMDAPASLTVTEFSHVDVRGTAHVKITIGNDFSVNTHNGQTAMIKDGRLTVLQPSTEGEVEITLPADHLKSVTVSGSGQATLADRFNGVAKLDVAGSGDIVVEKGIETSELSISVSGSGAVTVSNLQAQKINGTLMGSGDIKVSGNSEFVGAIITGSGDMDMRSLKAGTADCELSGSGTLYINARTALKVKITGSGDVIYTGNPAVDKKVAGSGNVIQQ